MKVQSFLSANLENGKVSFLTKEGESYLSIVVLANLLCIDESYVRFGWYDDIDEEGDMILPIKVSAGSALDFVTRFQKYIDKLIIETDDEYLKSQSFVKAFSEGDEEE